MSFSLQLEESWRQSFLMMTSLKDILMVGVKVWNFSFGKSVWISWKIIRKVWIIQLPVQVFKNNFELLGPVILEICNKSLRDCVFPSQLKTAKVIPLFKKGSRSHINNYRPVSILTSFSKILEKVVYSQLVLYLNRNNILTNAQHGFRPHCSTENAISSMLKYV